jgi:alanyl-tRNA synthetase
MLNTNEIRQIYLEFFQERGHELVESSSLIPSNDPSLLFTNAGMVPFKDMLLGVEKRSYTRAVSSQRCLRVGGKHNDLDNVGYTARHHTFFEMLGNFSFGDYFKKEAIEFAWELLTVKYGIPAEKLWITVHVDDDESEKIWKDVIGIDPNRISRLEDDENFWTMGDTGPCGPCSEIYYDHGESIEGSPPIIGSDPGDRFIEIWNLVFTQFDRSKDGVLNPLPNPCVDTGMGLERIAAVLQNEHNNYNIDLFKSLVAEAGRLTDNSDFTNPSLRVIADHLRASAFLIAEGIVPSNEGRGYVLRRIIRRALRHANKLGAKDHILSSMVPVLVKEMGDAHPLIKRDVDIIKANLFQEEDQFASTLQQGMALLEAEVKKLKDHIISGKLAFKLYDTFGFPVDMTADFAREKGLEVDLKGYDGLMTEQRKRARASSNFNAMLPESISIESKTSFLGYEETATESKVLELISSSQSSQTDRLSKGQEGIVFLDQTPFYAESGGQVGDRGELIGKDLIFSVIDTQKVGDHFAHIGTVVEGNISKDNNVSAQINIELRDKTIRNHSATHLLQAALRKVLGDHIEQKGSLVDSGRLRFDFTHPKSISDEEITQIEDLINQVIEKNTETSTEIMTMKEAEKKGAIAFFGDKYGEEVRVLNIGKGFSVELCGGTHVQKTGDIDFMKITGESGISAGVRRIEAVTGLGAQGLMKELHSKLQTASSELKTGEIQEIKPSKNLQALESLRELKQSLDGICKELNTSYEQFLEKVLQLKNENNSLLQELNSLEKGNLDLPQVEKVVNSDNKIFNKVLELKSHNSLLVQSINNYKNKALGSTVSDISKDIVEIRGYSLVATKLEGVDASALRETADQLRNKHPNSVIILISVSGDKLPVVVAVSKEVQDIDARDIMRHLVSQLGGSGGGRPDFAQGGVENAEDIEIVLSSISDLLLSIANQ